MIFLSQLTKWNVELQIEEEELEHVVCHVTQHHNEWTYTREIRYSRPSLKGTCWHLAKLFHILDVIYIHWESSYEDPIVRSKSRNNLYTFSFKKCAVILLEHYSNNTNKAD